MQYQPGVMPPSGASQGQNSYYQQPAPAFSAAQAQPIPSAQQTGYIPQMQGLPAQVDPAIAQQYAQYYQYMMYYQQMQQLQMQLQQQQQQMPFMMNPQQQQPTQSPQPQQQQAWGLPQPNDQGLYVLFVYHLPHNVTEDMLRAMFAKFGEVVEIVIMRDDNSDPASRTKGYGFIKYHTYQEASAAVQNLNGAQLENKRLEVSFKLGKGQKRN
jgi:hypothetical protein